MYARHITAVALSALISAGCSDRSPVGVENTWGDAAFSQHRSEGNLLTDIPVTQTIGGGTFEGLLSITEIGLVEGALVATGTLTGTLTQGGVVTEITQTFTDVALGLTRSSPGACSLLDLDLGPIFLDLLGLQVDLSAINLDLIAQSGPGKLLGNLLCAVAGLLDRGGPLTAVEALLGQINNLLGQLLG